MYMGMVIVSFIVFENNTFVMFFRRLITQHIVYNWDTYKDMAELCHSKHTENIFIPSITIGNL